jgi:hypothetical protein
MDDFQKLIDSLPDPEIDTLPPYVEFTPEAQERVKKDRREKRRYLNPKTDTEEKVKYVLTKSPLFDATLKKDGDWITVAGGRDIWQKKISDYIGGVLCPGMVQRMVLYVEVKGVSPGNNFQLSRLDRRTKPNKPSQHEKLCDVYADGNLVWLAIGWWDARKGMESVTIDTRNRSRKAWLMADVFLQISLIPWGDWLNMILPEIEPRRSIRQKDRDMLSSYLIYKCGHRWDLASGHWAGMYARRKVHTSQQI